MAKVYQLITGLFFLFVLCGAARYPAMQSPALTVPAFSDRQEIVAHTLHHRFLAAAQPLKETPDHITGDCSGRYFCLNNSQPHKIIHPGKSLPFVTGSFAAFLSISPGDKFCRAPVAPAFTGFFFQEQVISGFYAYHAFW